MGKDKSDVLQGTLDMLVLKALSLEPMHGWGITERIEQWSEQVLQLGQGTLYPALYRLERQGLIRSEWEVTENNRRARYYAADDARGRKYFADELAELAPHVAGDPDAGAARRRRSGCLDDPMQRDGAPARSTSAPLAPAPKAHRHSGTVGTDVVNER